jgi:alkylation response protein AidB-like acyl-CoA dehydrogenase
MTDEIDIDVLAESFSEFLAAEWPREKAVAFSRGSATHAAELWVQIAALGWPALTVSEAQGGLGLGSDAIAALHENLGAAAAPLPLLGTLLAVILVNAAGSEAQQEALLPGLADGSTIGAVGPTEAPPLVIEGNALSGSVANVLNAPAATLLFLRATKDSQPLWVAVNKNAAGVVVEEVALADRTRSLGNVQLDAVAIDDVAILIPQHASALDEELLRQGSIALAADALGGGNAVLAATVDYMKVREQFDRVIGSFQALKHRVADHRAALEAARGLVDEAAGLEADAPGALLAALTAKQHVTRIAAEVARDCIQLHGGVGFTSEYIPHIYLKRAKLNEVLLGTRSALLDRIADMLEAA